MRLLIAFLATLLTAGAAHGATEIAPRVHLILGGFTPGSQPDGNSTVIDARGGLIVIDSGRHAAHTQAIVDFARSLRKPVKAVINTHWHLDHIGGNAMLRREFPGVRIYASNAFSAARTGFLARYRKQLEEMIAATPDAEAQKSFRTEMALVDAGDQLAPDEVLTRSREMKIAGRRLRIGVVSHAATASDITVTDVATKVLIAGDLVTLPAPFLDTACPKGWRDALDALAKSDFTIVVPGHGAPMTRSELEAYRSAFGALLTCAEAEGAKDRCVDGWVTSLSPLLPSGEQDFTRMLTSYYVDLLRGDPSRIEQLCVD